MRVLLLGEPDDERVIGDSAAAAVVALLGGDAPRSVTLRQLPAGRGAAFSVLVLGPDSTRRVLLDADGLVVTDSSAVTVGESR